MRKKIHETYTHLMTYGGVRKVVAWICIIWGAFALLTPFTPGGLLFFAGLVMLLGKEEAARLTKRFIGERYFLKFGLDKFFTE